MEFIAASALFGLMVVAWLAMPASAPVKASEPMQLRARTAPEELPLSA